MQVNTGYCRMARVDVGPAIASADGVDRLRTTWACDSLGDAGSFACAVAIRLVAILAGPTFVVVLTWWWWAFARLSNVDARGCSLALVEVSLAFAAAYRVFPRATDRRLYRAFPRSVAIASIATAEVPVWTIVVHLATTRQQWSGEP